MTRNPRQLRRTVAAFVALGAALGVAACSVNPATGKRQLVLIGESQEISLGRDANEDIVRQYGVYEDEALQGFVADLGARLAATSERPDLPWTFQVVDDPVVNAFALPGGFIYVTRGILAHLESEAGLAGVLGHEIGHVTARHGASQMSRGLLAQIGLGVGSVVSPEIAAVAGLAQSGVGLLFLKYGRDDERQADDLGARYAERAGYDPRAMVEVFEVLERSSRRAGSGSSLPGWLSTHPAPEARQERAREALADRGDLDRLRRDRESYIARLDGLVYGADPREGYFVEDRFLHPELAFELRFPAGWGHRNERNGVLSREPDGRALVLLTLAAEATAEEARDVFAATDGITVLGGWREKIGGRPVESVRFRGESGDTVTRGFVAFLEHEGRVLRLLGTAADAAFPAVESTMAESLSSFRRVRDREILEVEPLRIRVETLRRPTTPSELAASYDAPVDAEVLAVLNNVEVDESMAAGIAVKKVTGRKPPG
ncbi:MAG: M48 family metalloprotease [Thermoanaerobaculia bacterium]|nr:M48 family metalloprotease [Thermoanaerobaculia bacterium]